MNAYSSAMTDHDDERNEHRPQSLTERVLYLEAGELRAILPFFLLYSALFLALTVVQDSPSRFGLPHSPYSSAAATE